MRQSFKSLLLPENSRCIGSIRKMAYISAEGYTSIIGNDCRAESIWSIDSFLRLLFFFAGFADTFEYFPESSSVQQRIRTLAFGGNESGLRDFVHK